MSTIHVIVLASRGQWAIRMHLYNIKQSREEEKYTDSSLTERHMNMFQYFHTYIHIHSAKLKLIVH